MEVHNARSLFEKNIQSAEQCLALYDGVKRLETRLQIDWLLRAGVVFVVSAIDAYFHDRIRYRVGRYTLDELPNALAKFEVPLGDLIRWDEAQRKGNVLRNWVTKYLSTKPLQSQHAIADALKLAGIINFWDTIEPDKSKRSDLLEELNELVKRRNQIAHEGDREQARNKGKRLRSIDRRFLKRAIAFAKTLVGKVETSFPT